jgi:hypothetical protein
MPFSIMTIYNYSSAPIDDVYERTDQDTKDNMVTMQSDYVLPLEKIGRFETGYKRQLSPHGRLAYALKIMTTHR